MPSSESSESSSSHLASRSRSPRRVPTNRSGVRIQVPPSRVEGDIESDYVVPTQIGGTMVREVITRRPQIAEHGPTTPWLHGSYRGLSMVCPVHGFSCRRYMSLDSRSMEFGIKHAEIYLGTWRAHATRMDQATHRKFRPSIAQMKLYFEGL